jgi:hypothetical protein
MVVAAESCSYVIHVVIVTVLVCNISLVYEEQYGIGRFPLECCYSWQTVRDDGLSNKGGKKIHGLSPRANYTDRVTAACRQSNCQLVQMEGATWSA